MLDRNDAWTDQLQAAEAAPDLILAAYAAGGSVKGAHDRLGDTVVVSRVADMGQNARDTGIHSHASPGSRKPELRLTT